MNLPEFDVAWYFDRGLERSAFLLDESNYSREAFPLFKALANELEEIARGNGLELGYSYPGGKRELRRLIAEHESFLEGASILPDQVVVHSGGCSGAFDNLFRVLSKRAKSDGKVNLLVPLPAYPEIAKSIRYNHLSFVPVQTDYENHYRATAASVERNIDEHTAAVFITSPGNPSCVYTLREEFSKILALCTRFNCYLVLDAIFEEAPLASRQQRFFELAHGYSKLIKLKSFSKDRPQLNDLRLGWSVSFDSSLNRDLVSATEVSTYSNSTILERLAIAEMRHRVALEKRDLVSVCDSLSLEYSRELDSFYRAVSGGVRSAFDLISSYACTERVIRPEAGNILFTKLKPTPLVKHSHELVLLLLNEQNTLVTPGHIYGLPLQELWFRITMAKNPELFLQKTRQVFDYLGGLYVK